MSEEYEHDDLGGGEETVIPGRAEPEASVEPEAVVSTLEALVAAGGDLGRMASELLLAKAEREAKAEAEEKLLASSAEGNLSEFEELDAVRLRTVREQLDLDQQLIEVEKQSLLNSGRDGLSPVFSEAEVADRVSQLKFDQQKLAEWSKGSDPLLSNAAYREAQEAAYAREQAVYAASTMEDKVAFAQQENDALLAKWASGDVDTDQ